jgi:hypothetical protein
LSGEHAYQFKSPIHGYINIGLSGMGANILLNFEIRDGSGTPPATYVFHAPAQTINIPVEKGSTYRYTFDAGWSGAVNLHTKPITHRGRR